MIGDLLPSSAPFVAALVMAGAVALLLRATGVGEVPVIAVAWLVFFGIGVGVGRRRERDGRT